MAFLYRKEQEGIAVLGAEENLSFLQIPAELEGLPVRRVEQSAFARRKELRYVKLPESLRSLGRFAFYGCPALETVCLGGGITDYGDGVFRQCGSLREVQLDVSRGDCTVLRELLADRDSVLRVRLSLPGGEACLTFPDYVMEFDEDTWARAIHTRIEGAGFAYRECVSRKGIDFREYDRAFARICRSEPELAAQIALDRLALPLGLEREAEAGYENFLKEHAEAVIRQVVESDREPWLRLLLKRSLLSPEAAEAGTALASRRGKTDWVALLMREAPRRGGRFLL